MKASPHAAHRGEHSCYSSASSGKPGPEVDALEELHVDRARWVCLFKVCRWSDIHQDLPQEGQCLNARLCPRAENRHA